MHYRTPRKQHTNPILITTVQCCSHCHSLKRQFKTANCSGCYPASIRCLSISVPKLTTTRQPRNYRGVLFITPWPQDTALPPLNMLCESFVFPYAQNLFTVEQSQQQYRQHTCRCHANHSTSRTFSGGVHVLRWSLVSKQPHLGLLPAWRSRAGDLSRRLLAGLAWVDRCTCFTISQFPGVTAWRYSQLVFADGAKTKTPYPGPKHG